MSTDSSRAHRAAALATFEAALQEGEDAARLFTLAFNAGVTSRPAEREHVIRVSARDTDAIRGWLVNPSGASPHVGTPAQRAHLEAVADGGLLIRTRPYKTPHASHSA